MFFELRLKRFFNHKKLRVWLLTIGFTLAFGSMFSKTFRVHAILTNSKPTKKVLDACLKLKKINLTVCFFDILLNSELNSKIKRVFIFLKSRF